MENNQNFNCELCHGEGVITARHKINKKVYVFVCMCDYSGPSHWAEEKKLKYEVKSWKIPRWLLQKQNEYEILK